MVLRARAPQLPTSCNHGYNPFAPSQFPENELFHSGILFWVVFFRVQVIEWVDPSSSVLSLLFPWVNPTRFRARIFKSLPGFWPV